METPDFDVESLFKCFNEFSRNIKMMGVKRWFLHHEERSAIIFWNVFQITAWVIFMHIKDF